MPICIFTASLSLCLYLYVNVHAYIGTSVLVGSPKKNDHAPMHTLMKLYMMSSISPNAQNNWYQHCFVHECLYRKNLLALPLSMSRELGQTNQFRTSRLNTQDKQLSCPTIPELWECLKSVRISDSSSIFEQLAKVCRSLENVLWEFAAVPKGTVNLFISCRRTLRKQQHSVFSVSISAI